MRGAVWLLAALALPPAHAAWTWEAPLTVNSVRGPAIFPHLESANRQGIAVSGASVAVVWEDNRAGRPHCYVAIRPADASGFRPETRLGGGECYEPVVVGLGDGRFVAAWEEDGDVRARVLPGGGRALRLSEAGSAQATLAAAEDGVYAAWAEQAGRFRRIVVARLALAGDALERQLAQPVEPGAPVDEQGWPALAVSGDGAVTVAWEDRRARHTVPRVSHSRDGLRFSASVRLSDLASGPVDGLGAGSGAMRPTLAAWGERSIVAVWLDKRDFLSGYDVYAAFDAGARAFGPNLQVQDSFGDNMAQWHAKVVADAGGRLLAIWDDARDGTPDVWVSEWSGEAFGDDFAIPAAAGPGAQSDPVATLDADGFLHVAWLDRDERAGTRVRYVRGVRR